MKNSKSKPKVKEKDNNIIKFDYMKTNKDNIMNVIKCPSDINIINDLVIKINKIVSLLSKITFCKFSIILDENIFLIFIIFSLSRYPCR